MTFAYSKDQSRAIDLALSHLHPTEKQADSLKQRIVNTVNSNEIDYQKFVKVKATQAKGITRALVAIETLRGIPVSSDEKDACQFDGFYLEEIEKTFKKLTPCLDELEIILSKKQKSAGELAAWRKAHPTSNNKHPFAIRLIKRVSAEWKKLGGEIDLGKYYRAFFEATVRPVLGNEEIKRQHKCIWTVGMRRNHVEQAMRRDGIPGTRGPKRSV